MTYLRTLICKEPKDQIPAIETMLYVTNYLFFLVVIGSSFILSDLLFNVLFSSSQICCLMKPNSVTIKLFYTYTTDMILITRLILVSGK